jgi:hypothetical protein
MTIRIFVQSEHLPDVALLQLSEEALFEDLRAACVALIPEHARHGDIRIFVEDVDEAVDGKRVADLKHGHAVHVHVSRCHLVHASVRYAGKTITHDFGPSATIRRVKKWAGETLGISEHDAAELVLQLAGSTDQPAPDKHLGVYAHCPACAVIFDLVATYRVNGNAAQ